MEIGEFHRHRNQLVDPWETDMSSDDDKFWEFKHHVFKIGNQATDFGASERPRVADLGAERYAGIDTGSINWIVSAIVGREIPQPGHNTNANKCPSIDPAPKLTYGFHRSFQIDTRQAAEPGRSRRNHLCYLFVRNQAAFRPVPG